jgi:hypothetical protein
MTKQKLLFTILAIIVLQSNSWASVPLLSTSPTAKTEINRNSRPAKIDQLRIAKMKSFIGLTADEYGKLRGKKLNFLERLSFKASQRRMRQMLKHYEYGDGPTILQKISWLIKGLLLGPIALLIGYLFLKDDDRELIKWIWFGFAGFAVIVAIFLLSL